VPPSDIINLAYPPWPAGDTIRLGSPLSPVAGVIGLRSREGIARELRALRLVRARDLVDDVPEGKMLAGLATKLTSLLTGRLWQQY
jgi:hypothetical protein